MRCPCTRRYLHVRDGVHTCVPLRMMLSARYVPVHAMRICTLHSCVCDVYRLLIGVHATMSAESLGLRRRHPQLVICNAAASCGRTRNGESSAMPSSHAAERGMVFFLGLQHAHDDAPANRRQTHSCKTLGERSRPQLLNLREESLTRTNRKDARV